MYRIKAGDPLLIELGKATSSIGNDVEVNLSTEAHFINFDEDSMSLSIDEGVTTNQESGVYKLNITLFDDADSLTKTYIIRLTIIDNEQKPSLECSATEELICFIELVGRKEIEKCKCESSCIHGEVMTCQLQEDSEGKENEVCKCEQELEDCEQGTILVCDTLETDGTTEEICECQA